MAQDEQRKQYFSERQGRGPGAGTLSFQQVRRMVISVFDSLRERGNLQEAFGYDCVDGDTLGTVGADPDAYFLRTVTREGIWPYWGLVEQKSDFVPQYSPRWESWDEDTLFDVIEVLHDLVSHPTDGSYHDYSNCGMHYHGFDRYTGQFEYREEINRVLERNDPPYELNGEGLLEELGPEEFRTLLDADVPEGTDHDMTTGKMQRAVHRFRARGASLEDRQIAVRELADVLEPLRADAKAKMLTADESALFHLANGFAIRHHNREQKGDYDQATWLRWAFYVYLATIHALLRVRDRAAP